MATLKEEALAYKPKQTKNIAELTSVGVDLQLEDRSGTDKEGQTFTYKVVVIEDEEYRVPLVVIGQIKTLLNNDPSITKIRVIKNGQGVHTQYTTIPDFGKGV